MPDQVTLQDACRQLHVSYRTLRKWLARLGIEPTQHTRDMRFYVLTIEQVKLVRDARSEMPQFGAPAHTGVASPVAVAQSPISHTKPSESALRDARGHIEQTGIPDGWRLVKDVASEHNIPLRTIEGAVEDKRMTSTHQPVRVGRVLMVRWLTPEQQGEFHRAFRDRLGVGDPCPSCGWSASSAARERVPTVRRMPAADT